jgi:hypothetical protein
MWMHEHQGEEEDCRNAAGMQMARFMIKSCPEAREPMVKLISSQAISSPED